MVCTSELLVLETRGRWHNPFLLLDRRRDVYTLTYYLNEGARNPLAWQYIKMLAHLLHSLPRCSLRAFLWATEGVVRASLRRRAAEKDP